MPDDNNNNDEVKEYNIMFIESTGLTWGPVYVKSYGPTRAAINAILALAEDADFGIRYHLFEPSESVRIYNVEELP